jgi:hypothetical protein
MSMIIRFIGPVFPSFSISKGIVLQMMMRSKGMNQRDICDEISRGGKAAGGTGDMKVTFQTFACQKMLQDTMILSTC